jgi:hypothetical protein
MLEAGVSADGGSKQELGSIMTMAVLSDGELTLVWHSKRNANVADVDSLEKAEKRVAIKNLDVTQGNAKINSVYSFPNGRIEQNLGGVGISLGDNENLILWSVDLIKDVERERLKPSIFLTHDIQFDFEEDEIYSDTSTISRLCGDLMEEVMDDNSAGLDRVLVDIPIKVTKSKRKKKPLSKKVAAKKKLF